MTTPRAPYNELERLAALQAYDILDTGAERAFDDLVALAATICGAPIALVSLVDAERQWFKARVGLDVPQTHRDVAFCAHAILEPDVVLVVEDALADPRFSANPLVKGAPDVRFYAGAPLVDPSGLALGTLCVIDHVPRTLSPSQHAALRALSRQVVDQLELRRSAARLAEGARAEQAAREQLQSLLDVADVLVQSVDPSMRFEFVNRCWREVLGYDDEDLKRLTLMDTIAPSSLDHCRALFARVLTGETVDVEATLLAKDGRRVVVEGSVSCHMEQGVAVRTRGIFREVTRERALEARSKALTDSAPIGIYYIDTEGSCYYANARWCEIAGLSLDEARGAGWAHAIHPDDRAEVSARWLDAVARRVPFSMEFRFSARGNERWVHSRAVEFESGGEIVGYIGTVEDIHARMLLQLRLRETTLLQSAILDAANYAVIATAPEGIIRVFSAGAERMLGYDASDVVGKESPLVLHDQTELSDRLAERAHLVGSPRERGFAALVAAARRSDNDEAEWLYRRKDGREVPVHVSVTALRAAGDLTGFLFIASDISERKKMERMKDEFIGTVSHELRTPLTSIRGALGLIAGGATGALSPATRQMVDIATKNSESLVRLIDDILDLERIRAGAIGEPPAEHVLAALVEQAIAENRPYADGHGVALELGASCDVRVVVDVDRVLRVIANLLSNAAKFSPRGARVVIDVERRGAWARVSVIDRGVGIPDDFRARIFQKFAQADASDQRARGSGLGLSISRALVEAMGGTIGFVSAPGLGTTFHFQLPAVTVRAA